MFVFLTSMIFHRITYSGGEEQEGPRPSEVSSITSMASREAPELLKCHISIELKINDKKLKYFYRRAKTY